MGYEANHSHFLQNLDNRLNGQRKGSAYFLHFNRRIP